MVMMKIEKSTELSALNDPERVKYLGVIDTLRELGVNEEISLPQLVVVGDQSSGKSSLLESLTGLSFPVASDLCTRFATEIVLRRSPPEEASARISLVPGSSSVDDENARAQLAKFTRLLNKNEIGSLDIGQTVAEASEYMGLPATVVHGKEANEIKPTGQRFSDDRLKIELSGPEHHHLSIVDVPGLFHNPTIYQTEEDKGIIRNLIKTYIGDSRTIILAVLDATSNLASQEVFKLARDTDPDGKRTVGIITKCDALQEGDESVIMKIADNSVERLKHGWFLVKNRSTKDIREGVTMAQRHEQERQFLSQAPWNKLPKDRRGIGPLKAFLGSLLFEHIKKEFPGLIRDIEQLLADTLGELDQLGPSRGSASEQRQYITGIASRYQRHTVDARKGNYDASLSSDHPLKLGKHIRDLNDKFCDAMTRRGHTYIFKSVDDFDDKDFKRQADPAPPVIVGGGPFYASVKKVSSKRKAMQFADDRTSAESIYDWIRKTYRDSRGSELPGTINPAVMETLFYQQSAGWEPIASTHLEEVLNVVASYNEAILEHLIVEEDVRVRLCANLMQQWATCAEEAKSQLNQVLDDERGILQTVNHYFADALQKAREERVLKRFESVGIKEGNATPLDMSSLLGAANLSNEDQAVNDIHDVLKAYYKVAIKRFMDNVVIAVVERNLLGPNGPVKIFDPEFAAKLSDDDLSTIAAETFSTSNTRTDLKLKAERFSLALEKARKV